MGIVSHLKIWILIGLITGFSAVAQARSAATPWSREMTFQNLAYGSSTAHDVAMVIGEPADEILKQESMYPIIENHYYYEKDGSGRATIFVFENNFLVGMHYKSSDNQIVDLTSFLINNGDARINNPYRAGYPMYYPYFPFFNPFGL